MLRALAADLTAPAVQIREEPMTALPDIAGVPIAFEVRSVFDVVVHDGGLGGMSLGERRLESPYVKDYDALQGEGPTRWASRFDLTNWGLLLARAGSACVGGSVLAFDTPGVDMLERRRDLAVLWDLRVAPAVRGLGVGAALFRSAEAWAKARGCRMLKIETQNVNVPACRFYARQGCTLGAIHRFAYSELPDEVQLLWYKHL
ncbi:MAG TPA: GNAT family N-acetyltransferase [Rhodothermales bacterium]|nr:GNAT family N-acetyltransferase [Rhodothermales bacterium]